MFKLSELQLGLLYLLLRIVILLSYLLYVTVLFLKLLLFILKRFLKVLDLFSFSLNLCFKDVAYLLSFSLVGYHGLQVLLDKCLFLFSYLAFLFKTLLRSCQLFDLSVKAP